VIHAALRYRAAVLALAASALALAVILARGLGSEFVPRLSEGALVVNVFRLPGTSLDEAVRANTVMERLLLAQFPDEVNRVWSRCGTAGVATDPMGPEETDMFITLKPRGQWKRAQTQDELVGAIKAEFDGLPGTASRREPPCRPSRRSAGRRRATCWKASTAFRWWCGCRRRGERGRRRSGRCSCRLLPASGCRCLSWPTSQSAKARRRCSGRR